MPEVIRASVSHRSIPSAWLEAPSWNLVNFVWVSNDTPAGLFPYFGWLQAEPLMMSWKWKLVNDQRRCVSLIPALSMLLDCVSFMKCRHGRARKEQQLVKICDLWQSFRYTCNRMKVHVCYLMYIHKVFYFTLRPHRKRYNYIYIHIQFAVRCTRCISLYIHINFSACPWFYITSSSTSNISTDFQEPKKNGPGAPESIAASRWDCRGALSPESSENVDLNDHKNKTANKWATNR